MDWNVFFSAFAGSTVVAAVIGGFVSLRIASRQILVENVTKERKKWREKIREVAIEIQTSASEPEKISILHTRMALSLNPEDDEDQEILRCIENLQADGFETRVLVQRLALLLKHDWERAKWEAKPCWSRWPWKPKRIEFVKSKYVLANKSLPLTAILLGEEK